ncbi:MAG: hypothetical protein HRT35_36960 [Algicola sp.]|nr:hypothetical protein [Algicola sp.]
MAMIFPLICLLFGGGFLMWYLFDPMGGTPSHDELAVSRGSIEWVKSDEFRISFKFDEKPDTFGYPINHRDGYLVKKRLLEADKTVVTVKAQLQPTRNKNKSRPKYHKVFEVAIGDEVIKSYKQVTQDLIQRNKINVFILVALFIPTGLWFSWAICRNYRRSNQE